MPSDPDSPNFFVRFKHRVDDQISQAARSLGSLPSSPSSSSNNQIQDGRADRALRDDIPSPDSSNDALTKADSSINGNSGTGYPKWSLESSLSRRLRWEAVRSWVQYSAYSPSQLQDTLPQPVPKDVLASSPTSFESNPSDFPESGPRFTFRDAFEDLLAVSSGQPLKPRAELESRLNGGTPSTLPPPQLGPIKPSSPRFWHEWAVGLTAAGQWDAYFGPPEAWRPEARRIAAITTSDLFRRELTADEAAGHTRRLLHDAAACEEERRWKRLQMFWPGERGAGSAAPSTLGTLFGGYRGAGFGEPASFEQHPLARLLALSLPEMPGDREDARRRRPDAETDEDLYDNVESDYAQGSRRPRRLDMPQPPRETEETGSALARRSPPSPQGGETGGDVVSKFDSSNNKNEEWTQEFPEPDGGKTVKSVARKSGPWMSHEIVTTTRYDADGNVVQRMSQRQHSASKEFRWSSSGEDDENEEKKKSSSGKGWFWTK
ncbi:hypothetical protein PG985_009831 [Apiospora marii]|uniref:uncharacterized protein n=1 Tax=Apiospora marii TaxID=335849 RepID=UPI00312EC235